MANKITPSRRQFIKIGGATMAAIPLMILADKAAAAMRTAMKYQDTPNAGKACADCMQFIPGKTAAGPGGCKLFPGDTEISPKGYCVAWTAKPK
jgi:hypothetical protein